MALIRTTRKNVDYPQTCSTYGISLLNSVDKLSKININHNKPLLLIYMELVSVTTKAIIYVAGIIIIGAIGLYLDHNQDKKRTPMYDHYGNRMESNSAIMLVILWIIFGGAFLLAL